MKEDQLLALLARLCGDITQSQSDADLSQLQQKIASAILNDPIQSDDPFVFERLENISMEHSGDMGLRDLGNIIHRLKTEPALVDTEIRVFRREVPVRSSQVRGSVPEWARGAERIETVGPIITRNGRRFWYDFYRVIPVVQVWLQGAVRPFLLLPLEVRNINIISGPLQYKIPAGSAWINADVFTPQSPDHLYVGLKIKGGTLSLKTSLNVTADNKLIINPGNEAALEFQLEMQKAEDPSGDDYGTDAAKATLQLPEKFSFTINHTGRSINCSDSEWKLYGQSVKFKYNPNKPILWNAQLNRIAIPYDSDQPKFEVMECSSTTCSIEGSASITDAAWALPAASINIAAPLQAEGSGAMAIAIQDGISASWYGLRDGTLYESSAARLKNALILLMPGRINIATLFANNPGGRHRYNCWKPAAMNELDQSLQFVDVYFTKQFFFFYDSLSKGVETIAAQCNINASVNRPVKVDGTAFQAQSMNTIFTLSMSKDLQALMLFDDDMLDKQEEFKPGAIALNNALLTVSPLIGFFLYADLKDESSFDKAVLVYSFGLLQYLPTLPDPYAANVSLLRRRRPRDDNRYFVKEIRSMLVCMMNWKAFDPPSINFLLGDQPAQPNNPPAAETGLKISELSDVQKIDEISFSAERRLSQRQSTAWAKTSGDQELSGSMMDQQMRMMMSVNQSMVGDRISPFRNAFTLLDVSTNADLMGVSLGFANDRLLIRKTHYPVEEAQGSPISIHGLDVHAHSKMVQIFTLPQISWEPMISISIPTNTGQDPYPGILYFLNDGVPAQIANVGTKPVAISPIPLTGAVTQWYKEADLPLYSYFTLSNGMLAIGLYYKEPEDGQKPVVELINQQFNGTAMDKQFKGSLHTSLQIKTIGINDLKKNNKKFKGSAHQLTNVNNFTFPSTNGRSVLSGSVTKIFNREFGELGGLDLDKYIPLERYDFSGYGANVFSHWVNKKAALAETSQAMFDVWRGRTAHEVIQVKSVIYPWAIRVVRTITIYRGANGMVWRTDSGWKAESDGVYDFRTTIKKEPGDSPQLQTAKDQEAARAYKFHPGLVDGVYNVRNIWEDDSLKPFTKKWNKPDGVYMDDQGDPAPAPGPESLDIELVAVYFDADVKIDNVIQGANNGMVKGQGILGYIQLSPRGVFIDQEDFAALLTQHEGIGGPVDCMVNINDSNQKMRVTRIEVNPSMKGADRVFVVSANGTPVLPQDGSWSVVEHHANTKEVLPLKGDDVIPLVRDDLREFIPDELSYKPPVLNPVNIAAASELFKPLESRAIQFGFLQSTGENKVLFRNPVFNNGIDELKGSIPDLADAYRLMNSKGVFPKLEDLPSITEIGNDFVVKLKEQGFKLLNKVDPSKALEQLIPPGPWYIIDTNDLKVYVEYKSQGQQSKLNYDLDSEARKWLNKMNDLSMYVDLAGMDKVLAIRGKFDTEKGKPPSFVKPILEFGPQLKPVYEILVLLSELSTDPNYADLLKKGLKIAMSNSPNNWEYKFQADKEIPVIKFPSGLVDGPVPLRIEASLKAGVYFNVPIPLPPTNGIQAPSAGAYVEFFGKLSVMCASVGAGSIYAVGQATVRIGADTVTGPALYMKFGFGVEVVVALPVIGSVSVYFAVGVEISLDSTQITVAGFLLFKGRAEILGGIVTVTIMIEASGKVQDRIGGETHMIAQVIFSLDISICFIIDISFTEKWEEERLLS